VECEGCAKCAFDFALAAEFGDDGTIGRNTQQFEFAVSHFRARPIGFVEEPVLDHHHPQCFRLACDFTIVRTSSSLQKAIQAISHSQPTREAMLLAISCRLIMLQAGIPLIVVFGERCQEAPADVRWASASPY
jgi:hypothetical protein